MNGVSLTRVEREKIAWWTPPDGSLIDGVVVGFTERGGGVSEPPYASLNLAAHVGDKPSSVDENRRRLLDAAGLGRFTHSLVVPEQVHGAHIHVVTRADAGRGASAASGPGPIAATDALIVSEPGLPVMLCFADCVPVIIVAPGPAVAVVHAGWRGALASLPGLAATALARHAGCDPSALHAFVGPHIGACHYEVDATLLSQFVNGFGTLSRAVSGGLDLGFVVSQSLRNAGVDQCNLAALGTCTAERTDRFFSHRAEAGRTGRHAAFACVLPSS